jgi:hypothetical protein
VNALNLVWIIYLLIIASAWMALLAVASAIAWGIYEGWRWFKAWRAERQLQMEIRQRRGWRELKRRGWVPKDLQ